MGRNGWPLILLIEDDDDFASALELRLLRRSYRVQRAPTGDIARGYWRKQKPDAIVLDLRFPGKNGIEILKDIREDLGTWVPVIILTAYSCLETVLGVVGLGVTAYLDKPLDTIDDLLRPIEEGMEKSMVMQELEYLRSLCREAGLRNEYEEGSEWGATSSAGRRADGGYDGDTEDESSHGRSEGSPREGEGVGKQDVENVHGNRPGHNRGKTHRDVEMIKTVTVVCKKCGSGYDCELSRKMYTPDDWEKVSKLKCLTRRVCSVCDKS